MADAQTEIILVTDLVGSTAIRSEVGEDAAEELRRRHDAVLTEAVVAHGGVVIKSLGDGVLARFAGAASAVVAACRMQRQVDGRFDVRIGISAGDVTLENDDCFGAPVIEASRLCDRAQGGQILVADLVRMLARGRGGHVFEPVGDLELKGVAEPVATSQVVWDESRYNRVRFPEALFVGGMPFVGRGFQMETIIRRWLLVASGATQVILISGEPGMGKTRLVAEAALNVYDRGSVVLHGRCDDGAASDHHALTEALMPLVTDLPDHAINAHVAECGAALVGLLPMLSSRVPGLEQATSTGDSVQATDEALVDLLRRASEVAPVVLVLEDLHHARDGTAQTFGRLARTSDLGSVLIVGTYSHTEVRREDPIRSLLTDLQRADDIQRIRLLGLDVDAVTALVTTAHEGASGDRPEVLASEIHRQTGGSPFFVEDALRQLNGSGTTYRLDRSIRLRLGISGVAGIVMAAAIVVAVVVADRQFSALEWLMLGGATVFFAAAGSWLLAQVTSAVTVTPEGLTVRATGGVRTTIIPWDEIDAIRWRPPSRWAGSSPGGFFIETVDGRRVSNPLIDHPTPEFAHGMYSACRRHHVNDIAIRAKWPKLRSGATGDWKPVQLIDKRPPGSNSVSVSNEVYGRTAAKRRQRGRMG